MCVFAGVNQVLFIVTCEMFPRKINIEIVHLKGHYAMNFLS